MKKSRKKFSMIFIKSIFFSFFFFLLFIQNLPSLSIQNQKKFFKTLSDQFQEKKKDLSFKREKTFIKQKASFSLRQNQQSSHTNPLSREKTFIKQENPFSLNQNQQSSHTNPLTREKISHHVKNPLPNKNLKPSRLKLPAIENPSDIQQKTQSFGKSLSNNDFKASRLKLPVIQNPSDIQQKTQSFGKSLSNNDFKASCLKPPSIPTSSGIQNNTQNFTTNKEKRKWTQNILFSTVKLKKITLMMKKIESKNYFSQEDINKIYSEIQSLKQKKQTLQEQQLKIEKMLKTKLSPKRNFSLEQKLYIINNLIKKLNNFRLIQFKLFDLEQEILHYKTKRKILEQKLYTINNLLKQINDSTLIQFKLLNLEKEIIRYKTNLKRNINTIYNINFQQPLSQKDFQTATATFRLIKNSKTLLNSNKLNIEKLITPTTPKEMKEFLQHQINTIDQVLQQPIVIHNFENHQEKEKLRKQMELYRINFKITTNYIKKIELNHTFSQKQISTIDSKIKLTEKTLKEIKFQKLLIEHEMKNNLSSKTKQFLNKNIQMMDEFIARMDNFTKSQLEILDTVRQIKKLSTNA